MYVIKSESEDGYYYKCYDNFFYFYKYRFLVFTDIGLAQLRCKKIIKSSGIKDCYVVKLFEKELEVL